jgi:hypothetical protein
LLLKSRRIKHFTAYPAIDQSKRNNLIPLADQQMLKLDGILGANPPALTATCAFGHIVFERPPAVLIDKIQGRSRAVFTARQTPITVIVNPKVRHKYYPIYN